MCSKESHAKTVVKTSKIKQHQKQGEKLAEKPSDVLNGVEENYPEEVKQQQVKSWKMKEKCVVKPFCPPEAKKKKKIKMM